MNTVRNFNLSIESSFEDNHQKTLISLSGRINYALRRKGISKAELAKMIGVKHQVIQYLCSNDVKNSRFLPLIAEALDINIEWLTLGQGAFQSTSSQQAQLCEIPLLDDVGIRYLCAAQKKSSQEPIDFSPHIKDIILSTKQYEDKNSIFCFRVQDTSMYPVIPMNSLIFVDRSKTLIHDSYGLFLLKNNEIILRKIKKIDDSITLIAFNDMIYKNFALSKEDFFIGGMIEIRWFV